jgi:hypothetical protein
MVARRGNAEKGSVGDYSSGKPGGAKQELRSLERLEPNPSRGQYLRRTGDSM